MIPKPPVRSNGGDNMMGVAVTVVAMEEPMRRSHSPNDQRSIVKNLNNPAYTADRGNRINQGHVNTPPAPPPAVETPAPKAPQPKP